MDTPGKALVIVNVDQNSGSQSYEVDHNTFPTFLSPKNPLVEIQRYGRVHKVKIESSPMGKAQDNDSEVALDFSKSFKMRNQLPVSFSSKNLQIKFNTNNDNRGTHMNIRNKRNLSKTNSTTVDNKKKKSKMIPRKVSSVTKDRDMRFDAIPSVE